MTMELSNTQINVFIEITILIPKGMRLNEEVNILFVLAVWKKGTLETI